MEKNKSSVFVRPLDLFSGFEHIFNSDEPCTLQTVRKLNPAMQNVFSLILARYLITLCSLCNRLTRHCYCHCYRIVIVYCYRHCYCRQPLKGQTCGQRFCHCPALVQLCMYYIYRHMSDVFTWLGRLLQLQKVTQGLSAKLLSLHLFSYFISIVMHLHQRQTFTLDKCTTGIKS